MGESFEENEAQAWNTMQTTSCYLYGAKRSALGGEREHSTAHIMGGTA